MNWSTYSELGERRNNDLTNELLSEWMFPYLMMLFLSLGRRNLPARAICNGRAQP